MRNRLKNQHGITLIEVVVSVAIMSTAIIGLVGALTVGLRVSTTVEEQAVAATLVSSQLEEFLADDTLIPASCPTIALPEGYDLTCVSTGSQVSVIVLAEGEELMTGGFRRGVQ